MSLMPEYSRCRPTTTFFLLLGKGVVKDLNSNAEIDVRKFNEKKQTNREISCADTFCKNECIKHIN